MNPDNDLPLRDIHLPDGVSWWPPAPGWWLLALIILLVIFLVFVLVKKIRQPVLKKSARAEVENVISGYRKHGDKLLFVQELSIALRRIGISYLPRNSVAGEIGPGWYAQLNQLVEKNKLSSDCIELLCRTIYQKKPALSDQQVETMLAQVRNWVASLSRSAHNV